MENTWRRIAIYCCGFALACSPLVLSGISHARYPSKAGKICDKHMEKVSQEYPLKKQFNFAFNCIERIRLETGRTHDAYLLWLSEISEHQGKSKEAMEYAWWAIGATRENNKLDKRSANDFLSVAFMAVLFRMTSSQQADSPISQKSAESLHDWSLAILKLSNCTGSQQKDFVGNRSSVFGVHETIDFNLHDTTLTKEDRSSHCGVAKMANILSLIAIKKNPVSVQACMQARSVINELQREEYRSTREALGWIYLKLEHYISNECSFA